MIGEEARGSRTVFEKYFERILKVELETRWEEEEGRLGSGYSAPSRRSELKLKDAREQWRENIVPHSCIMHAAGGNS